MLTELLVENFALIENLQITFHNGLNIISGETGAGKSLLTDAVGLLAGGRGERNMIRTGEIRARVEATFTGPFPAAVKQLTDESNDNLILSREIQREGKNICRLNGRKIGLSLLTEIGGLLLNIHSQLEHVALFQPKTQLAVLDSFGGAENQSLRQHTAVAYEKWRVAKDHATELKKKADDRTQRMDYLQFQISELQSLNLRAGETEELRRDIALLRNSATLYEESRRGYTALYGGEGNATEGVYEARQAVEELTRYDESMISVRNALDDIYYRLEELSTNLYRYSEQIDTDSQRLEYAENRLELLERTFKKYHVNEDGLLAKADEIQSELSRLEDYDQLVAQGTADEYQALEHLRDVASKLTALRRKDGEKLSERIVTELHELALPKAEFEIAFQNTDFSPLGSDELEFRITLNAGEELRSLASVASGGEMSRIMLALKVILARLENIPTLIFDEIDSGTGGRTARRVGERLQMLANDVQVIAVTHSPIVASFARQHYVIEKMDFMGRSIVTMRQLDASEVCPELARMISGNPGSTTSLAQADELLKEAHGRR